ncbi:MAG: TlpA family protein disulfide reductase [Candidatus Marinimicrobia bacterium]|jgi:peroxiredoxin|nr:TlpA family protein disulfide reductase [Candidatus Neomarinimicrobiota bacterium]
MDLKYRIFYFVVVLSFLWGNTEDNPRGFVVNIGDSAPDFSMKLTTGETLKLSELKGSIVILQFTASWCSVCRLEMPHLEEDIWKKYKEKNVVLIGIDRDEPLETVINFKKQMKITYPLALDPGAEIFSLYAEKNSGVTRNIVIDQSGKIVFLTRLFEENEYKQMLKIIEDLVY